MKFNLTRLTEEPYKHHHNKPGLRKYLLTSCSPTDFQFQSQHRLASVSPRDSFYLTSFLSKCLKTSVFPCTFESQFLYVWVVSQTAYYMQASKNSQSCLNWCKVRDVAIFCINSHDILFVGKKERGKSRETYIIKSVAVFKFCGVLLAVGILGLRLDTTL